MLVYINVTSEKDFTSNNVFILLLDLNISKFLKICAHIFLGDLVMTIYYSR